MPATIEANDRNLEVALAVIGQAVSRQNIVLALVADRLGLAVGQTSTVPAFDRPSPVVVVGPRPLPVDGSGGSGSGGGGGGGGGPKGGDKSFFGDLLGSVVGKLAVVFGPLIAFSTILQSATSGFAVFIRTISVLGSVLGTLLLPFFIVLGAAILTAADIFWSKLRPVLSEFYQFVIDALRPAALELLDLFEELADAIVKLIKWINEHVDQAEELGDRGVDETKSGITLGITGLVQSLFGSEKEAPPVPVSDEAGGAESAKTASTAREARRDEIRAGFERFTRSLSTPEGRESKFNDNLKVMIQSFANSIGPKASFQSLAEGNKQVQLAAINEDPIDAKMLKVQLESLEELKKVTAHTTPRRSGRYDSDRDFEGSGSAGGAGGEDF